VSQLHQEAKLDPEQISNQLWDLVSEVKRIAVQYAVDHLLYYSSAAGRTKRDEFTNGFPVSSNPPTSSQENYEPRTPLSYPSARSSPVHTTDDDNRWLLEQPLDNFSFPNVPSHATDPSAFLSHGTCRPSDLMLPPEIHNHQFTIDRPNPGDSFAIGQLAPYSPSGE
jgi:hypothetical protein